ncbi:Secondary metabolism regulator LAE1 [Colletotrichum orbiculare MAFF 240422]|uniref:Secondary metabolism regulator LAE1 n=1 Tax=Colletotrichum orbiculare (strain 104-T / ATCC 96160 / CBS 514.97 / LARS 414 / MAFF 240422) TaxID=1213857 RepID=N4VSH5_COLOR|nr:Secondary metabolism regulator LAE1 [Colletotrichum orbiculare MAFF 240422]
MALNADTVLVPDDEFDEENTDLESLRSEYTSLRSSILEGREENGRVYHSYKEGKYAFPSDEQENDRLDMQNTIITLTFNHKLGFAPPCDDGANAGRVLDLGTGTGVWAIEYAELHPESEVLGVDLAPIQPGDVPPNVQFEVDDVEEEWLYSQTFDYIHIRFLNGSIADWKKLISRAFAFTKPGGYFELQENDFVFASDDDTLTPDKPLAEFSALIREACSIFGRRFVPCTELKEMLTEAGFEDVKLQLFKWPSNPWPKDPHYRKIGQWNYYNFADAAEALAMAPLTRAHGWSKEEVQVFTASVRKDMRNPAIHSYMKLYTIVGRKPEKKEAASA